MKLSLDIVINHMLHTFTRQMTSIFAKDIRLFLPSSILPGRENNDKNNKIREDILPLLVNPNPEFMSDHEYGPIWTDMSTKFNLTLSSLSSVNRDHSTLISNGGITNNHDYTLYCYDSNNTLLQSLPIEFKHNATSIDKLPQFLELTDKSIYDDNKYNMTPYSYAEFYYDLYLPKYIDIINRHRTPEKQSLLYIPDKSHYLKHVQNFKTTDEFFLTLKQLSKLQTSDKKDIVAQSYHEYLQQYAHTFSFEQLTDKLRSSQKDKIYIMWDYDKFNVEQMNMDNIILSRILPDSIHGAYFTIETHDFQFNLRVRINWGNTNGILNPRWKFTLVHK